MEARWRAGGSSAGWKLVGGSPADRFGEGISGGGDSPQADLLRPFVQPPIVATVIDQDELLVHAFMMHWGCDK